MGPVRVTHGVAMTPCDTGKLHTCPVPSFILFVGFSAYGHCSMDPLRRQGFDAAVFGGHRAHLSRLWLGDLNCNYRFGFRAALFYVGGQPGLIEDCDTAVDGVEKKAYIFDDV